MAAHSSFVMGGTRPAASMVDENNNDMLVEESSNDEGLFDNNNDRPTLWRIPDGAVHIIEHIAAVHLLQKLLKSPVPFYASPIHVDYAAVIGVIRRCPAVCQETFMFRGKDGQERELLPLALICTLKPPLEAVATVYEAFPGAICAKEPSRGSIPLHYAAAYDAPFDVLEFLVQKYPKGLAERLTENISPLDLACYHYTKKSSYINIRFLLQAHPEAAREFCSELNWYPLHSAVVSCAPLDTVVRPLFNAFPEAASSLGRGLDSPLHVACKKKNYQDVVQFLIHNSAPEILTTEDQEAYTPTLLAAMHQPPFILELLTNLTRTRRDHKGWTLLHLAAVRNEPPAIMYLAARFPEMVTSRTRHCQCTPLHLACRKGASLDNIRTLVKLNRNVLHMTEATGKTPLELALRRQTKEKTPGAVVDFLRGFTDAIMEF